MDVRQTLDGRYKLLNELGSGGMAVVWRARDEVLGRPVAVKVLAGRYAGDPQSRARIRDEARSAANLSHPNIAQVYDYGEADEDGTPRPYVVMELVNGPTLQQRMASGPLPPRTIFRICGEVAAALAAAHAEGLVHRDIKMANVMVTTGGAKVVDFGIAAAAGRVAPDEMLVGTPAYLAPERLTGGAVLPASDVYALGVLLYRLLADESPWSVESTTQMLKAHVYVEPAPLPALPGVPPAVAALIARCLRKDPQDRPAAARVSSLLADAAEEAAEAEEVEERKARAEDETGILVPGRSRGARARAAGTATALAAGAAATSAAATGAAATGTDSTGAGATSAGATSGGPANGVATRPAFPAAPAPLDRPEPPAKPRRAGGVRLGKRTSLLVAGGVAAVIAAALAAWLLIGDGDVGGREAAGGTTASAAPARNGGLAAPSAAGSADATRPAATEIPGRAVITGTGPVPSVKPSGSAPVSSGASQAAPGPSGSPGVSSSASAAPAGKRLNSPGGAVFASCAKGKATLTDPDPAEDFVVERVEPGPALTPLIVFKGPANRYRMTVTCVAGSPTPVVLPL